ncbi:MAG: Hsp20/alpha crystallin family protein [Verrucomicrobiae bacterium]|nr:Hsp20/alpha crystallin family protein [Verrucomicrobiae bacterium]
MRALTQWDPFRELENFSNQLATAMNRPPTARSGQRDEWLLSADWAPSVDILEDDKAYTIKADLPEVKKEDVKVTVENGVLVITGERRAEKEEKGRRYRRIERSHGSFVRSFTVPEDADSGKVNASFKDGLLIVTLPKSEEAKPRSIDVKVS